MLKSKPEIRIICIEKWMNWRCVSKVKSAGLGDVLDARVLTRSCPVVLISGWRTWNERNVIS